ncbi:MAG: hypothetical protein H6684_12810 [Deltaproteobacteria bacterium]|nr:hypothetical protein [Deltaproteobacteria bacterium]MCB9489605.1 hypothetical protein [Deltaproteobacteria bacterium]
MITGERERSLTQSVITEGYEAAGMSPTNAEFWGSFTDDFLGMALTLGATPRISRLPVNSSSDDFAESLARHADDIEGQRIRFEGGNTKAHPPINMGQQGKHQKWHKNYVQERNRSVLTADPENLAMRHGTGEHIPGPSIGQPGSKERIVLDEQEIIGQFFDRDTSSYIDTNVYLIHYSNEGIHMVPGRPRKP